MTRQFADFRGRTRRRDFWMFAVFYLLTCLLFGAFLGIVLVFLQVVGVIQDWSAGPANSMLLIFEIVIYLTLVPVMAINVRRLHDLGYSGWWALPQFLPNLEYLGVPFMELAWWVVGLIYAVWFMWPGQPGANKWGQNPKNVLSPGTL